MNVKKYKELKEKAENIILKDFSLDAVLEVPLFGNENNELFLQYFKTNLLQLVESQLSILGNNKASFLPQDFYINHIASTFVETARWWIGNKLKQTPEEITEFFLAVIA